MYVLFLTYPLNIRVTIAYFKMFNIIELKVGAYIMKINAQILYHRLKKKYPVKIYGEENFNFLYSSPEFYMNNSNHLYANTVYLASVDCLPSRPLIEKNVVLICIGESNHLFYYKERATVITIQKKVDFFQVYNYLKEIFDLYHKCESQLIELFMKSPSIQDILDCIYPVIERSIFILNSAFQFVASIYSDAISGNKLWRQDQRNLDTESFILFLREKDLMMDKRGTFLLDFDADRILVKNLFNSNEEYIGCIFVYQEDKPFIEGEEMLVEYLASIIEWISQANPTMLNQEQITLKESLQTMVNEMPLNKRQKMLLKSSNYKKSYFCISIHSTKASSTVPINYLCSTFESLFKHSIFFEYNNSILGLIPVNNNDKSINYIESFRKDFMNIIRDMRVCVGISNPFKDLYMLGTFYKQAEAAIDNGRIYQPDNNIYLFADFALTELVTNSLGSFPLDTYFPKGFDEILSHDLKGSVSYLETLSIFLDESMSYSNAARRLYIHRSTLIERINRIKNILHIDLNNPDHRLQLQIILKLLDIEQSIKRK